MPAHCREGAQLARRNYPPFCSIWQFNYFIVVRIRWNFSSQRFTMNFVCWHVYTGIFTRLEESGTMKFSAGAHTCTNLQSERGHSSSYRVEWLYRNTRGNHPCDTTSCSSATYLHVRPRTSSVFSLFQLIRTILGPNFSLLHVTAEFVQPPKTRFLERLSQTFQTNLGGGRSIWSFVKEQHRFR